MDDRRRKAPEERWQEINRKLDALAADKRIPIEGVDASFYRGQLLKAKAEVILEKIGLATDSPRSANDRRSWADRLVSNCLMLAFCSMVTAWKS